jgi:hypothetical protein
MERRLFGGPLSENLESDEGGIDSVDEIAERRGAMPKRGDGGWAYN